MSEEILIQFEIWIGSIGVTISLFFALLLFFYRKKNNIAGIFLAIYLLAFGLRTGKSLFHYYFDLSPTLRTYFLNLLFCVGPSLWLFTKYLLFPRKQVGHQAWRHYALFLILLPLCWFIRNNGSIEFMIFYKASILHMLGYMIYALYWLRSSKKEVKTTKNDHFYNWLNSFLCCNILLIIIYFLISIEVLPYYMGLSFSYSLLIIVFGTWALSLPNLLQKPTKKYQASSFSTNQAKLLFQKLKGLMEEEKLYLDASLNLLKLSERIGATPKEVSQAINQMEQINYSKFIAQYRIEEAKRLLKSPKHAHFKIAAIAYESGFNSLSSFNALFKKYTTLTAQEFRQLP